MSEHVARLVRYMDLVKVDPASYWIGPLDDAAHPAAAPSARFTAEQDDEADTVTLLDLPLSPRQPRLVTGLLRAVRYLIYLLSEDGVRDRLDRLDAAAGEERLPAEAGIDAEHVCRPAGRPSVAAWAAGRFIAPDGDGYTYFLVEDHGRLVTRAHSAALAPAAWAFAADAHMQRTDLSGTIGAVVSGG
jgi:hypothetical protein